jgi:ankyrin repeat protein
VDAKVPLALLFAAFAEHSEVVDLLLARGDRRIDRGDREIIRVLREAGADSSASTPEGETALSLAKKYGNHAGAAVIEQHAAGLTVRRTDGYNF